jgi:hypothetical protein
VVPSATVISCPSIVSVTVLVGGGAMVATGLRLSLLDE